MAGKEKTEPTKPELVDGTPSAIALAKVGHPSEKASDEELNEHAARYAAEKKKARWG